MKKCLLIFIIFWLFPSFAFSGTFRKVSCSNSCVAGNGELTITPYSSPDDCVSTPSGDSEKTCINNTCEYYGYDHYGCISPQGYGCACPSYVTNSVGGCNSSPIYCSTSSVYQKVASFLGKIENASRWTYYSTIGTDNNTYKCVLSYTRPSGGTVIVITGTALSSHNPVGSPWCVNGAEYNALVNTNCSLSTGWAVNSGYITNYRDGTAPTQNPDDAEGTVVPPGSIPEGPTGQPIDSPTGLDGDKDGFDDVTGQPIPFTPAPDTDEVEIKDPEPDEIPAVPSGGEYDTEITSPEKTPLSGLFDIIDSSPFISVIQGTHIFLSGSQCLLTTANTVYGQYISFDFCDSNIVNILDYLGIIIVGIAAILAILLIFV